MSSDSNIIYTKIEEDGDVGCAGLGQNSLNIISKNKCVDVLMMRRKAERKRSEYE